MITLFCLFPFPFRNYISVHHFGGILILVAGQTEATAGSIDWLRSNTNNGAHYPLSVCGFILPNCKINI